MSEDDLYELKDEPWMLKRVFTGEDFIETPTIGSSIEERIDKLAEKFYTLRYEGESTAYVKTKSFMRSALTELAADLNAEHEKEVAELKKALEVEIAERDRLREQLRFSADDNILDEVKRVLAMAENRALDWDMLGRAHGNSAVQMWREDALKLLTRLGGTANE